MMKIRSISRMLLVLIVATAFSVLFFGCDEKTESTVESSGGKAAVEKTHGGQSLRESDGNKENNEDKDKPVAAEPAGQIKVTESVQEDVDSEIRESVSDKRKDITEEARSALMETENALRALNEKKPKEALEALERATGKLEILLARYPRLALAPTAMHVSTRDVLSTLDEIIEVRERAKDLLEDGEVQKARAVLAGLASEIVIGITNLPLASYPEAIKAISPLVDEGKINEAKIALQGALSTLVVTEHVIPIPILRAEMILKDAEPLAEKEHRSKLERDELTELLENAKYQIELAKALGYGEKADHKRFLDQIEEIEKKTQGEKAEKGLFDNIKSSLKKFKESVFE